jgi:hypothetical protein
MKKINHPRILVPGTDPYPQKASTKVEIGLTDPSIKSKEKRDKQPVELKLVQANSHDDIDLLPSTITAARQSGIDADFLLLIKKIALHALVGFKPGDRVDSTKLCAEIRYGLSKDKPVIGADAPGLSKGERLNAGTAILILANAGELPLERLGRNGANLQQYRVE